MIGRRQAAALLLGGLAAGCATPRDALEAGWSAPLSPAGERLRLAPVWVSEDRIIRVVAGLRPYRPGGFVVQAERRGSKLLVHNYGHGGAGVTLSWGTSEPPRMAIHYESSGERRGKLCSRPLSRAAHVVGHRA